MEQLLCGFPVAWVKVAPFWSHSDADVAERPCTMWEGWMLQQKGFQSASLSPGLLMNVLLNSLPFGDAAGLIHASGSP